MVEKAKRKASKERRKLRQNKRRVPQDVDKELPEKDRKRWQISQDKQ